MANGSRQIGTGSKQKVPRLLIVDGQQRLTSLYAVLQGKPVVRDDYTPQNIHISFRPRDAAFEVTDAAIRRDPEFIPDISKLWAGEVARNRFVKISSTVCGKAGRLASMKKIIWPSPLTGFTICKTTHLQPWNCPQP